MAMDEEELTPGFADDPEKRLAQREFRMGLRDAVSRRHIGPARRDAIVRRTAQEYKAKAMGVMTDPAVQDALAMSREAAERRGLSRQQRQILQGGAESQVDARVPPPPPPPQRVQPRYQQGGLRGYAARSIGEAANIVRSFQNAGANDQDDLAYAGTGASPYVPGLRATNDPYEEEF